MTPLMHLVVQTACCASQGCSSTFRLAVHFRQASLQAPQLYTAQCHNSVAQALPSGVSCLLTAFMLLLLLLRFVHLRGEAVHDKHHLPGPAPARHSSSTKRSSGVGRGMFADTSN